MKLFILQENFSKALNVVSRNISQKSSIPILSNILLEAKGGNITLSGTNLDTSIRIVVGAEIQEEGKVCVPAKTFADFINLLPSGRIELKTDNYSLDVTASSSTAKFQLSPAEDFPQIPNTTKDLLCSFKPSQFIDAVSKVSYASAKDNLRPILTGVLIEPGGQLVSFVGADGNRLSKYSVTSEGEVNFKNSFVIPFGTMDELVKIITDRGVEEDTTLEVYSIPNDNQILFRYNGVDFLSRLLEGQYPDYQAAVPTKFKFKFSVAKDDFSSAVKIANVFAQRDGATRIYFNIDLDNKSLTVDASAQELGSNNSTVDLEVVEGTGAFKTAFNIRYLMDYLNHTSSKTILFSGFAHVADPDSTGAMWYDSDNDKFYHMIMPLRVS